MVGCVEQPGCLANTRIGALVEQDWQPAHFKVGTGADHQVSPPRGTDQARAGLYPVWVLGGAGGDGNACLVACQLLNQGPKIIRLHKL